MGKRDALMLLLKAGDMWAFVSKQETSLLTLREITDEFGSLSAQRTVYNSKENATVASHLIGHPERQTKYPGKLFSINPRCVSCLKPQARFHTQHWGRGPLLAPGPWVLTYWYIRTKNSHEYHLKESGLPSSQAPEQFLPVFISNSHLNPPFHPTALCTAVSQGCWILPLRPHAADPMGISHHWPYAKFSHLPAVWKKRELEKRTTASKSRSTEND